MPKQRQFKQLTGAKNYRPWSQWDEGDYVQGKLTEKIDEDNYGKPNYVLELEEGHFANKEAAKKLEVGKPFVLNSATLLDNVMKKVEIGSIIRVEYMGKEVLQKGQYKGKEAITLDIGVAEPDDDASHLSAASNKKAKETEVEESEDDSDL